MNKLFTFLLEIFSFSKGREEKSMSVYPEVRDSVVNLVDFIKTKTNENLVEASRADIVELNENQLNTIIEIVDASITQGMTAGFGEIESCIKNIDKTIQKNTATKTNKKKK